MEAVPHSNSLSLTSLRAIASIHHMPCQLVFRPVQCFLFPSSSVSAGSGFRSSSASIVAASTHSDRQCRFVFFFFLSMQRRDGVHTVGDFMTRKEDLHVIKPTTTVDEALETLVEHRITGFPLIDDDWKLVGLVSDYDLLALDSISGQQAENDLFPVVDSTWKKLLSKTNGQIVGDLMTPAPVVVRETTNLEDAARILLERKYRRLPVVDAEGKLVGIITRGNVVRAALEIKRKNEGKA